MSCPPRKFTNRCASGRCLTSCGPAPLQVGGQRLQRRLADRHDALLASPCRAPAARAPRGRRRPAPARSPRRRAGPDAYISSSSARSRSACGSPPLRLGEQPLDLAARQHLGQLAAAPRRAQRGRRVRLAQALAAQVAVEGAQAGGLAVDRGGRRGPVLGVAGGQLGQEVADVAALGVERRDVALGEEAPELQQVARCRPRACCATARARTRGRRGSRAPGARSGPRPAGCSTVAIRRLGSPAPRSSLAAARARSQRAGRRGTRAGRRATWRRGTRGSRRRARRAAPSTISMRSSSSASALSS